MKLKTRLSLTFALTVLLTVALISVLANFFIGGEFRRYIAKQQEQRTQEIVSSISAQYDRMTTIWDVNFVHTIGMYALHDGYIVNVFDAQGETIWSAEECDMEACRQLMEEISQRMQIKCPKMKGKFIDKELQLTQNGNSIGTVNISYYGPYFLSDNDFHFLDALNKVLVIIGVASLLLSVAVGLYMAKRISDPVGKTAEAALRMADGNYDMKITARNDTKELGALIESVNHLAESLGHQEALRKRLTADVAHELRTPITTAQTHLEAMIEGLWETTPERLASCYEELARIGTLVKDLEGLAKVENENLKLNKTHVNLLPLFEKAVSSFEREIEDKALTVTMEGTAPEVPADEGRIRQVAVNLLSNAIKYTPNGGHIRVTFSQTEDCTMFSVADDGMGIPPEDLPFVFERFYRTEKSRNRKTGGSGIGLAVVKAIVSAHDGKVEAESNAGGGSCFRVMLPR